MSDPSAVRARTRRKRVSRRRYLVRRAAVVGVVVVGGFGAVRVAGALAGDGEPSAQAVEIQATVPTTQATTETTARQRVTEAVQATVETDVVEISSAVASSDATAPVDDNVAPTTVAPTTTVAPSTVPGPPTAEDPAQVLVVGDSFAGLWGPPLKTAMDATGVVQTEIDYQMSTGLADPRRVDWFERVRQRLSEVVPDVVVTSFGGNDFLGLVELDGSVIAGDAVADEAVWLPAYQQRAGQMMDLLGEGGRTVIWVGTANHPDPAASAGLAVQDKAAKAAAAERPSVVFIDTWDLLAGRNGGWAEFVIDPRDNAGVDARMGDGFHPNEAGAELLAAEIDEAVRAVLLI